jgi:hypothetical protein
VSPDEFAQQVSAKAVRHAHEALARRRPDLRLRTNAATVPDDEHMRVTLDRLAYTRDTVARLQEDITALVLAARSQGASWAKVGLALGESAQTAFNRYQRFESSPVTRPRPNSKARVTKHSRSPRRSSRQ